MFAIHLLFQLLMTHMVPLPIFSAPPSLDWSAQGLTTPVKDQGNCGSCWATSVLTMVESRVMIQHDYHTILSTAQLVDCDTGSNGCRSGRSLSAMQYIRDQGACRTKDYHKQPTGTGCLSCKPVVWGANISIAYTYKDLMHQIQFGPVVVFVDGQRILPYSSGILSESPCIDITHSVTLVGYGTDEATGIPYWKVQNSWGEHWGEKGYFRIRRGYNDMCIEFAGFAMDTTLVDPSGSTSNGSSRNWAQLYVVLWGLVVFG
jgi:C1A family cysteine protease